MKQKPSLNQSVVLCVGGNKLYTGFINKIIDTMPPVENTNFTFDVVVKNQVYIPASEFCLEGLRDTYCFDSSSF